MSHLYETVLHTFGPGQTVHGVLKFYNDNNMSADDLEVARVYYLIENTEQVRRSGEEVKIPVLPKYQKT